LGEEYPLFYKVILPGLKGMMTPIGGCYNWIETDGSKREKYLYSTPIGDPASRFRFLAAIYEAVRSAVGDDYPVMVKLGVADGFADGLSFSEGKVHALRAAALGFDALEISQGVRGNFYAETEFRKGIKHLKDEAYFRGWTQAISRQSAVPLIMVGGLRSLYLMETIVSEKQADLVALSRPLIREPDLIDRWQQGDYGPSRCISCNHCFEALLEGNRLCCASKEM
jgi:2,4-dienoyl-CoA reductase-like NADH-dependent reductase (Old Yellow Enzyme family)